MTDLEVPTEAVLGVGLAGDGEGVGPVSVAADTAQAGADGGAGEARDQEAHVALGHLDREQSGDSRAELHFCGQPPLVCNLIKYPPDCLFPIYFLSERLTLGPSRDC